jgi:RNA polymerase sigma-70 factor (ECF subfamily)
MSQDDDAALLLAFQRGDQAAFRLLYERNARAMIAYCHRFVRDAARAEELAQDVFVKLYRSAHRYQPSARFKTFLYRVATNHCLNEVRRAEFTVRSSGGGGGGDGGGDGAGPELDDLPSGAAGPHDEAVARRLEQAVVALLGGLPEKQRAAFVLCRFEGMSYEEIAETLETSVSAVKSLIHRATVSAAAALAPFDPGGGEEARP